MQKWRLIISAVAALTIFSSPVLFAQNTADGILEPGENSGEDLAKESQNPIGNIISLPFENNFDFGVGEKDALVYSLNLKPVYPLNFGKVNLINRFILPVIYQEERFEGEGSEFGLGDFTYQAFLSPAKLGKIIWGTGPAFIFPTNTDDRLGVDKWSAGPAAVALAKPGHWLVGALVQHTRNAAAQANKTPPVNHSFVDARYS